MKRLPKINYEVVIVYCHNCNGICPICKNNLHIIKIYGSVYGVCELDKCLILLKMYENYDDKLIPLMQSNLKSYKDYTRIAHFTHQKDCKNT